MRICYMRIRYVRGLSLSHITRPEARLNAVINLLLACVRLWKSFTSFEWLFINNARVGLKVRVDFEKLFYKNTIKLFFLGFPRFTVKLAICYIEQKIIDNEMT